MINICSDQGRIGIFWWINSDPATPLHGGDVLPGIKHSFVRWGTCGVGRDIHIAMEPLDD